MIILECIQKTSLPISLRTSIWTQVRSLMLRRLISPYISRERSAKLEKAMRAAKMARLASAFLNAGGLEMLTGR